MTEQTVHLNDLMVPAKSKAWGCRGCKLFQYAPGFSKRDRDEYQCTLDPHRRDKKNTTYRFMETGPDDAEVLVLFDHPSKSEDASGKAFEGAEARMVRRNAGMSKIDFSAWRWSYLLRCRPPEGVKPSAPAAVYCTKYLVDEITRLKPKFIITFGVASLISVLGKDANIAHYVGQPQDVVVAGHSCVVYPMQSPSYVQRNDFLAGKYLEQFERLASFLRGEHGVLHDKSIKSVVQDPDDAIRVCHKLLIQAKEGRTVEADLETSGLNPYKKGSRISVVSLGTSKKRGYALMIDHNDKRWSPEDRQRVIDEGIKPLLTHPTVKLRWHNGKFDVKWIRQHYKFWPRDQTEDTMLTHYAVDENMEHGLKPLALMYTDMGDYDEELDRVLAGQTFPDAPRYDLVEAGLLGKYAAMDVVATRKLAHALRREVDRQDEFVRALAYRAMPAFSATLTRLEHTGCHIDTDYGVSKLIPYLKTEAEKSYQDILSQPVVRQYIRDREEKHRAKMKRPKPIEVKRYFNFSLDSPQQLKDILYDPAYYGHEVTVFTDKGAPSTDKEALNDLAAAGSPIAKAIMDHRLDIKMVTTYGEPIIARLAEQGDEILHGDFLLHGTRTGRLSSRNPNLQNQPNKGNGAIKRLFDSRYGDDGVFLQVDFSQIELRILAAVSGDPHMLEAYRLGKDLHTMTACMIFNMTEEEFSKLPKDEQKRRRTVAKRVNFGIAYGIGAPGIQSTLKSDRVLVSEDEARSYLDSFYEKYPRVTKWIERVEQCTTDDEFSLSLFGRRRRLESVRSHSHDVVARALRQGVNHVIQSTAGDLTMTALCLFDQETCLRAGRKPSMILPTIEAREFEVDERWKKVHPILQVHDMIGVDCHKDVAAEVADRLVDTMQNVVDYAPLVWGDCVTKTLSKLKRVPIIAEPEVGPNWRDAVKIKAGKDIPRAMHIARIRQQTCDADIMHEWTADDNAKAEASYKAAA